MKILVVTLLTLLLTTSTSAQADAPQPASAPDDIFAILEEQEVVTGTRVAVKQSESPTHVWIVDRRMIDSTAAASIGDLLRRVPGLVPMQLTTGDTTVFALMSSQLHRAPASIRTRTARFAI